MSQTITFTNPYEDSKVKELLEEKLLIPRKIRHFLRTKKHVLTNNQIITWQDTVKKGDLISLIFDDEDYPPKTIKMGDASLVDCLYQDQNLIVVNKPAGMKSHGNEPNELALLNHVSAFVGQTSYIIHRLDMETSGLIIFAKNPFILPIMNRLLEKRQISREYWALVEGYLPKDRLVFQDPIGRHRYDRRMRVVDYKKGQAAHTEVRSLKTFSNKTSLLSCQLKTGRTHQIRVHLAHHRLPIVGDPLYNNHHKSSNRLMLHAHRLSFIHPLSLENICLEATSPSFEKGLPNP
ncbi:RluA family pseudouridine synthase [Streptococcus didelphis]|uniref:Pseudouridine synthase n=1 Tax=Streptococcus didelphis TaxID=102886 RepID=A0ABY9LIZ1_9STRE|nr:RluA family pseudouridine synthase [Streptococcus didelphis]WMB28812.1 RluA family pseudouridine synthase [Streptococcus didelphis]